MSMMPPTLQEPKKQGRLRSFLRRKSSANNSVSEWLASPTASEFADFSQYPMQTPLATPTYNRSGSAATYSRSNSFAYNMGVTPVPESPTAQVLQRIQNRLKQRLSGMKSQANTALATRCIIVALHTEVLFYFDFQLSSGYYTPPALSLLSTTNCSNTAQEAFVQCVE
jgi:hypothetical protein